MGTVIEVKKQSFRIRAARIPEAMEVLTAYRAAHPAKAGVGSGVGYDFTECDNCGDPLEREDEPEQFLAALADPPGSRDREEQP
jgi:hypothetical protein